MEKRLRNGRKPTPIQAKLYDNKIQSDWPHAKIYRYKNYTEEEILNFVRDFIKYHKETVIDKRLNEVKKDFE